MAGLMVCKCYADEQKLRPTVDMGVCFLCWMDAGFPSLFFFISFLLLFTFTQITTHTKKGRKIQERKKSTTGGGKVTRSVHRRPLSLALLSSGSFSLSPLLLPPQLTTRKDENNFSGLPSYAVSRFFYP
jgi:uncharacterized membrane protein